ncbi:MAG: hypothetical protein HGA33_00475 [Candidatus Moranbacteria bacterium]|nr:hypothetical protein [Candidatus Moranbacteria bacterium]
MTGNAKELLARLRARSTPLAEAAIRRMRSSVTKVQESVTSVVGRMTVKERLLVLFAVGIVFGFGIKTVASGFVTMGYQDYTLKEGGRAYDLNELERRVAKKNESQTSDQADATTVPEGGQCQ